MIDVNLPGDLVHHISGGYGRLLVPWFGGRWLIFFRRGRRWGAVVGISLNRPPRIRLMDRHFHNCRRTGVR